MTWTNKLWKFATTPDDVNMSALQADITAKADGDSGAPKNKIASMDTNSVDEDVLVAEAVNQLLMPTSQGSIIINLGGDIVKDWGVLPGGSWGFYPEIKVNGGDVDSVNIVHGGLETDEPYPPTLYPFNNTSYTTTIAAVTGSGSNLYAQQRYITASPPYDLGEGLCHRFTFLKIDRSTGEIQSMWTAPDAPWHNNGPTNISGTGWRYVLQGEEYDHRQLYQDALHIKRLISIGGELSDAFLVRLQEWFAVEEVLEQISITEEVSQEIKNKDMSIIPHPFSPSRPNCDIVLLDPMSDLSAELNELENDGENILDLFYQGFFIISPKTLARIGPPGVKTVTYRWK